jgi:hypothetical protein
MRELGDVESVRLKRKSWGLGGSVSLHYRGRESFPSSQNEVNLDE